MEEIEVYFLDEPREIYDVVDDPEFSNVFDGGEVYELFEITRIAREYLNHPFGWTHFVEVKHSFTQLQFTADIRVANFSVEDSAVYDFG